MGSTWMKIDGSERWPCISSILRLLIPRNFCRAIVALVAAFQPRAREEQPARCRRLDFTLTLTSVERKKNWCAASLTPHAEIPSRIGLGPSRNIHLGNTTKAEILLR